MKNLTCITVFIVSSFLAQPALAQSKEPEKPNHRGNYMKVELSRKSGDISGLDYKIDGAGLEFEKYFKKNRLGLSGWSIGARKDTFEYEDSGYLLNFETFRSISTRIVEVKIGGGIEWGRPPLTYDKTEFTLQEEDHSIYKHVYIIRNSNTPRIGTSFDGVIYPFFEASILKRKSIFLIELGARANLIKFGIDTYDATTLKVRYTTKKKTIVVPTLFVSLGLKLW